VEATNFSCALAKLWRSIAACAARDKSSRHFRARRKELQKGFESLVDARFRVTRRFSADFAQFHP
jgi:hypothetical protein